MKLIFNYFLKFFLLGLLVTTFNACQQDEIVLENETSETIISEQNSIKNVLDETKHAERYSSRFLYDHENCGGHTIERHIEKSDNYLYNRLRNSSISAASTFYNRNQAGQLIYNSIYSYNASRVNNWLNSSSNSNLVIYYTHSSNVGKVMERGSYNTFQSRRFRVILSKRSCISYDNNWDNDYDFTIITAYPY